MRNEDSHSRTQSLSSLDNSKGNLSADSGRYFDSDGGKIWSFRQPEEAVAAARQYVSGKLNPAQRRRTLTRLYLSYEFAPAFINILSSKLYVETIGQRHQFLDYCNALLDRHIEITAAAPDICRQIFDPNYGLRAKAASVLLRLGEKAAPIANWAVGMSRAKIADIQINGLNLLAAIGPVCAELARPKVEQLLRGTLAPEVARAATHTLQILSGEIPPLTFTPQTITPPVMVETVYQPLRQQVIFFTSGKQEDCVRITNLFTKYGAQVVCATAIADAVALLRDTAVNLAIFSVEMPDGDGAVLFQTLRSKDTHIPIYAFATTHQYAILLSLAKFHLSGCLLKNYEDEIILKAASNSLQAVNELAARKNSMPN